MLGAAMLLSSCATTRGAGEAGCAAYAEARLSLPDVETIAEVPAPWRAWIVETDTRMTGVCR
jgi:hypothetical protein